MKGCSELNEGESLLSPSFFSRDTVTVARDLLGREILRKTEKVLLRGRIVETEAYLEKGDPAAHSCRGPTLRSKVMFGEPGAIYVYFIYGNYFMLNFVTEKVGTAGAVLIRAVEPLVGLEKMMEFRGVKKLHQLTNGPGKLAMAFDIDRALNEKMLGLPHLAVSEGKPVKKEDIIATTRIGISSGKNLPLRFYEKGNPFVSKL